MAIHYGRQDIDEADIASVVAVLRSDFLTQGPAVPRFENAIAKYVGAKHALAVNSATAALHIACMALELGPGDRLWTSPTTFVASANCALYCGATVDFVDINPRTFNMCEDRLAEKLAEAERSGTLPKIVIPVHMCGQPSNMRRIRELADRYGFKIIEDASHAIGARYEGEPVGNGRYGDITVFSFHPVKIITTAEGGMAVTNDDELADRMRRHRSHGITSDREKMAPRPPHEIWNYQQIDLGYNYRMTDMQAALGASQLNRLDEFVRARHRIADRYERELAGLPLSSQEQPADMYSSYHLYIVRLPSVDGIGPQQRVYRAMQAREIFVNLHYIPVYRQPYYETLGFRPGYCPEAERHFHEAISLPMYSSMTDEQQTYVLECLREALRQ